MNAFDLRDRTAVVTGAAQGIGLAIAERLIESGARVAAWDRDSERLREVCDRLGGADRALPLTVELTDPDAVEATMKLTADQLGRIDIMVNNAGISGPNAPVAEYPVEDWKRVVDIDLNAVFYCCRAVVPRMLRNGYGRIVNVASIAGKEGNPNAAAYSAAKAGVIALTKSLGKELAGHDVAVNCITPAAARTAIFDQMTEEHINYMLSKIPRNRFVKVEEIAAMVAFLVSEENSFTTGAVFDLSGGRATY